jgi:hypothetical protein
MILESKDQSFSLQIVKYSAKHIAEATGCSLPTAYDWKSGRRKPVKWIQARYIKDISNHKQQNIMPESEDLSRYTAPPDNPPEERTYYTSDILEYIESCFPKMSVSYHYPTYSIDEIRDILKQASENITDEDYGISTI